MVDAVAAAQSSAPAQPSPKPASTAQREGPDMFHSVLSALNPLQYLPVVGTIYRAVTGDEVAEPVRRVGSAVGSFLMGGPIGLALNIAGVGAEKVLGFDFDKAAQGLLSSAASMLGVGGSDASAPTRLAWTPAQLSAYGVSTEADGTLTRGDLSGADVLNTLEMSRIERTKLAAAGSLSLSV